MLAERVDTWAQAHLALDGHRAWRVPATPGTRAHGGPDRFVPQHQGQDLTTERGPDTPCSPTDSRSTTEDPSAPSVDRERDRASARPGTAPNRRAPQPGPDLSPLCWRGLRCPTVGSPSGGRRCAGASAGLGPRRGAAPARTGASPAVGHVASISPGNDGVARIGSCPNEISPICLGWLPSSRTRNLLARIAQLADSGEVDDYLRLFTDDAVWQMSDNPRTGLVASTRHGLDDIAAGVRERRQAAAERPDVSTMHFIATSSVEVNDDLATAISYFQFVRCGTTELTLLNAGRYDDTMRRTDAGWKLASRTITFR